MRTARIASHPDETDLLAARERNARRDTGIEHGEVAVRPGLAVARRQREPDPATGVRVTPGALHDRVRERVDGLAHRRLNVRGRIVVMEVGDDDDGRPAADREDVVAVVLGRREHRPRCGREG